MRKPQFFQSSLPCLLHPCSVFCSERATVGNHASTNSTVSCDFLRVLFQSFNVLGPSDLLVGETWDKLFGSFEFNTAEGNFVCQPFLLVDFLFKCILQSFYLPIDRIKGIHFFFQKCSFFSQKFLCSLQFLSQRTGLKEDFVKVNHGLYPQIQELDGIWSSFGSFKSKLWVSKNFLLELFDELWIDVLLFILGKTLH